MGCGASKVGVPAESDEPAPVKATTVPPTAAPAAFAGSSLGGAGKDELDAAAAIIQQAAAAVAPTAAPAVAPAAASTAAAPAPPSSCTDSSVAIQAAAPAAGTVVSTSEPWLIAGCERDATAVAIADALATGRTPAVVVLAGSFNPVHQGHVRCVEEVKRHMDLHTPAYKVVAALLSPASDTRVTRKFQKLGKGDPMALATRIEACAAAASHLPWLGVLTMEAADICAACADSTEAVMRAAEFVGRGVEAFQITTSESVDTYGGWDGCVAWESEQPGRVFPKRVVTVRAGSNMPEGTPPDGWYLVPPPAAEDEIACSSTKVRAYIAEGKWDELADPQLLGAAEAALLKTKHEKGEMYMAVA